MDVLSALSVRPDALIRSRNVPAVALSARLGQPNLYQFLRDAGIAHLASEHHYGLSLALGGGEVTMEETAALYAMLANGGNLASAASSADRSRKCRHANSCRSRRPLMTTAMLQQNPRPDDQAVRTSGNVHVAWKTGTSWGFRDAWTAGIFGHYVLVVWVGNFDSSSNPAFVGIQVRRAPVLPYLRRASLGRPEDDRSNPPAAAGRDTGSRLRRLRRSA